MNEKNPTPDHDDALALLDDFEQRWVGQLAQREPDLAQTEDAFVHAVMRRAQGPSAAGAATPVLARIGTAALPYAVAAAVLLVGVVGWVMLSGDSNDPDGVPVVENSDPPQPDDGSAVAQVDRPKVALGALIANIKSTATDPANTLTTTVNEAPEAIRIDRLFDLVGDSVPDLKEILAPLEPDNEQSRA